MGKYLNYWGNLRKIVNVQNKNLKIISSILKFINALNI